MINSVFGKTKQNNIKHRDIRLVTTDKRTSYWNQIGTKL